MDSMLKEYPPPSDPLALGAVVTSAKEQVLEARFLKVPLVVQPSEV